MNLAEGDLVSRISLLNILSTDDQRRFISSCKELVFLEMEDSPLLFVGLYILVILVDFGVLSWGYYFT